MTENVTGNYLSDVLSQTANRVAYDEASKRILANRIVLAHIMKGCMEEYADCTADEIEEKYICEEPQVSNAFVHRDEVNAPAQTIMGASNEDASLTEGKVTFDVRVQVIAPGRGDQDTIHIILNVEAQKDFHPGYPLTKRAIYYAGRMLSAQYGSVFSESDYGKLRKVYSIWICLNPPMKYRNTMMQYQMQEKALIGNVPIRKQDYDMLTVIMIYLDRNAVETFSDGEEDLLGFLNTLFSSIKSTEEKRSILETQYGVSMTESLEGEVDKMCNASMAVLEDGIEIGRKQGLEQGLERGLEQGLEQGLKRAEERFTSLSQYLIKHGRSEDVLRAATDADYRNKLYEEFHI